MAKRKTQDAETTQPTDAQTESSTPPTGPAAGGPGDTQTSFLSQDFDRLAERPNVKRASVLSDREAGVRLYFDYENHRAEIAFETKPGPDVITYMRAQPFNWDRDRKVWYMPILLGCREQDRFLARKTFYKACEMVRQEKGIEAPSQSLPD